MKVLAWHFLTSECCTGEGNLLVRRGQTMHVEGQPVLCHHGLHASKRLIDALGYAPGPIVQRVELSGEIVSGTDKWDAAWDAARAAARDAQDRRLTTMVSALHTKGDKHGQ